MDEAIKRQWIADLRSGEFEQGKGYLGSVQDDGTVRYCCLGVLTMQYFRANQVPPKFIGGHLASSWTVATIFLSAEVMSWAAMVSESGALPEFVDGARHLAELNDGTSLRGVRPHTFAEIADIIEQYL